MAEEATTKSATETRRLLTLVTQTVAACSDRSVLLRLLSKLDVSTLRRLLKSELPLISADMEVVHSMHRVLNPFYRVSNDMIQHILTFLSFHEMCQIASTSYTFAQMCMCLYVLNMTNI